MLLIFDINNVTIMPMIPLLAIDVANWISTPMDNMECGRVGRDAPQSVINLVGKFTQKWAYYFLRSLQLAWRLMALYVMGTAMTHPQEEEKHTVNKGPFLRDDIMALCDLHLFAVPTVEKPPASETLAVEPPPEPANSAPVVKKTVKPKWLKM
eukprot:Gb_00111 [translate_table: standard]